LIDTFRFLFLEHRTQQQRPFVLSIISPSLRRSPHRRVHLTQRVYVIVPQCGHVLHELEFVAEYLIRLLDLFGQELLGEVRLVHGDDDHGRQPSSLRNLRSPDQRPTRSLIGATRQATAQPRTYGGVVERNCSWPAVSEDRLAGEHHAIRALIDADRAGHANAEAVADALPDDRRLANPGVPEENDLEAARGYTDVTESEFTARFRSVSGD
jgi:hypothetical protein